MSFIEIILIIFLSIIGVSSIILICFYFYIIYKANQLKDKIGDEIINGVKKAVVNKLKKNK